MPIVRAGGVVCAAAATTLAGVRGHQTVAGCAGGRHPGRRMEAESHRQRRSAESAGADARRSLQAHRSTVTAAPPPDVRRGGTRTSQPEDQPLGEDPAPVRTAHALRARIRCCDRPWLSSCARASPAAISSPCGQGPGEFALDYGTSQRSFTPGAAQCRIGAERLWQTKPRVERPGVLISVRAQLGPDVTERYGLSADGKHLWRSCTSHRGAVRRGSHPRVRPEQ